jgi:hypothetical protein
VVSVTSVSVSAAVGICCGNEGRARRVEDLDNLGKIGERAGQPVDLVDDIDPPRRDVGEQLLESGPIQGGAAEPAVSITLGQAYPAFVALSGDEGLTGLALRLQRIEFLLEPLLGGFAGVDRAADGCFPTRAVGRRPRHWSAQAGAEARARFARPKNRGPDQCAPAIHSAMTVSQR